ncbi:helix-turn-helix domain-containing protein [Flavobacterium sp. JP2137]|uniref:helix-turn-helix domain-containing protein n=1 Tax=Flavobacterium sp. JP2137 TaxID=3414510 RepID=UPI003D2FC7F0
MKCRQQLVLIVFFNSAIVLGQRNTLAIPYYKKSNEVFLGVTIGLTPKENPLFGGATTLTVGSELVRAKGVLNGLNLFTTQVEQQKVACALIWEGTDCSDNLDTTHLYDRSFKVALGKSIRALKPYSKVKESFCNCQTNIAIAAVYFHVESYDKALKLWNECEIYLEKTQLPGCPKIYLEVLIWKMRVYERLGEIELLKKALVKANNIIKKDDNLYEWERLQCAVFESKSDLDAYPNRAIARLQDHLNNPLLKTEPALQSRIYRDIGFGFLKIGQERKGLGALLSMDSIVKRHLMYADAELRCGYEKAIEVYGKNGNKEEHLYFTTRLLYLNRIGMTNCDELNHNLYTFFEKRQLLYEKASLETSLKQWRLYVLAAFLLFMSAAGALLYWLYKLKNRQECTLIEAVTAWLLNPESDMRKCLPATTVDVKREITAAILTKLANFEAQKGFLDREITLSTLAKKLETNTAYLSKVINTTKGSHFSAYINRLRIEFIYNRLKTEEQLLKYTIEGIAKEAGFKTAQKFSNAFLQFKAVRPSVFIKALKRDKKN